MAEEVGGMKRSSKFNMDSLKYQRHLVDLEYTRDPSHPESGPLAVRHVAPRRVYTAREALVVFCLARSL